jgi:DNA polymerase-1
LALIKVDQYFKRKNINAYLVNMIHDELVIECQAEDELEVKNIVVEQMKTAFKAVLPNVDSEVSFK